MKSFQVVKSLWPRRSAALLWLVVMVVACAGKTTSEQTQSISSAALTDSPFEGNDGNLIVDGTGTPPTTQDWANVPNFVFKTDLIKGQGDDTYAGGKKENSVPGFTTDAIPPRKTDLTRFYVASEQIGSNVFLYLGWQRTADFGDVNLDFEFNQASPAAPGPNSIAPAAPRTAGDILVTYDFSGNGGVALGLLTWITAAPADPTKGCFAHLDNQGNPVVSSFSAPGCWGNRVDLTAAGFAEGAVNNVTVKDPKNGNADIAPHLFGEAAINLTASGVISPTVCKAFHTSYAHSRSSESFDSSLQDFVGPLGVDINTCVPVTIQLKKTAADGTTPLAGAVLQLFYDANNDGDIDATDPQVGSNCTTTANGIGDCTFTVDRNGKYIGHELTPPPGYSSAPDPAPVTVTLTSQTQPTITIVFNNSVVPGRIDIVKKDDADNLLQNAIFTLYKDNAPTGGSPGTGVGGEDLWPAGTTAPTCTTNASGTCSFTGLAPGLYWVVETQAPPGYTKANPDFVAVDLPLGSDPNTGATKSVTFINPRTFKIIVVVCRSDGTLYPSTINVDSLGNQTSISAAQANTAGLGEAALCDIPLTQAGFGDRGAGSHSGTMNIP